MRYFDQNPDMMPFARQARHLRGIDSSPNMKEVLDLISQEYEACVVFGKKTPVEAIQDAAQAVNLLYLE
jgi:multiple sugar transport system substrate-binding protein